MIRKLKVISLILIFLGLFIRFFISFSTLYSVSSQNRIIDDIFYIDVSKENDSVPNDVVYSDYLGYIYIPKFNIKRIIKYSTDDDILDDLYVGIHRLSGSLSDDDMVILAGHNVSSVFSKLHNISNGDEVYINSYDFSRKFIVYDKKIVDEYDIDYLLDNRKNELLLITCTQKSGERLLVFLKEVL